MQTPLPTAWNQLVSLDQMRNTVRRMTARYTEAQMTTPQIDTYINLAYTLHFPEQFKNTKLIKPYVFTTVPNVDTYTFDYQQGIVTTGAPAANFLPGNITVSPPVYCQGYILRYYQDKTTFYNRWPNLSVNQQINTGTGSAATTYTGNIPSTPFFRGQLDTFGNLTESLVFISSYDPNGTTGFSYAASDIPVPGSNTGNLVDEAGNIVGDVNYITGQYHFKPVTPTSIPAGFPIWAAVTPYLPSRPTDILFFNQQFIFRPVPMQVYNIEFQVSMQPTQLILANQAPELDEWYLFICAIAAKLIYTDFPDEEGMAYLMPIYQEQLQIAQRRTLRQMASQRAQTIFSQPGRPLASWYFGTEYSGTSG